MLRDSFEEEPMAVCQCPVCEKESLEAPVKSGDYRPPDGIDPRMREFPCTVCGHTFYKVSPIRRVKPTERLPGL